MTTVEGEPVDRRIVDFHPSRLRTVLFGDRIGEVAFVASVVLFSAYWITDWRISDSLTLLNALEAMTEGRLYITEPVYGSGLDTPGTHIVDGRTYGRNYGILTLALLPLAVLDGLAAVADLRIVFAGAWSLGVLSLTILVGRVIDRPRTAARSGAVIALALFGLNVVVATDLDPARTSLYALQLTHLIAAAFGVVFAYRLVEAIHGKHVGALAATLVALGTPIGFWATIPKRHVVTATVVLVLGYALYQSREADDAGASIGYRAGAYALIGLLAWVHAPEALMVFVIFAAIDVPTASHRDVRSLAVIALAFFISLIPFFVTNTLISGSPVKPPRALPLGGEATADTTISGGSGGGSGGGNASGGFLAALDPVLVPFRVLSGRVLDGLESIVGAPGSVVPVFVRSHALSGWASDHVSHTGANLTILETSPLLAAMLAVVPAAVRRARDGFEPIDIRLSPVGTVDLFFGTFAVLFTLLYIASLPLHAQITVRYLFPIVPVLVYFVVRLRPIRHVARDHWRAFCWTLVAGVFIGGQLLLVALVLLGPGVGEAFQFHALFSLATAIPLGAWALSGRYRGQAGRLGAVLLGLATVATVLFLLFVTLEYYDFGDQQILPIVRALGEAISFV